MSEREQKYADAVRGAWTTFEAARAVMAVADAEQAELRAEVERAEDISCRLTEANDALRAERDALRAQVEAVRAATPAECWTFRAETTRCVDFVGALVGGGPGTFTPDMVCLPCRLRAALASSEPVTNGEGMPESEQRLRPLTIDRSWDNYRPAGEVTPPAEQPCKPEVGFSDEPTWCGTHRRALFSCEYDAARPTTEGCQP